MLPNSCFIFLLFDITGPREQINQNSAFLDGSQVYGDNACLARELRGYGGRLNVTVNQLGGKDLLPQSSTHPECRAPSGFCFIAGIFIL